MQILNTFDTILVQETIPTITLSSAEQDVAWLLHQSKKFKTLVQCMNAQSSTGSYQISPRNSHYTVGQRAKVTITEIKLCSLACNEIKNSVTEQEFSKRWIGNLEDSVKTCCMSWNVKKTAKHDTRKKYVFGTSGVSKHRTQSYTCANRRKTQ